MSQFSRRSPLGWTSLGAAVLAAGLWFGCADAPQAPEEPAVERSPGQAAGVLQALDLTPALEAQERHGPALMRIPGVVGHGVGVDADGNPRVTVFTLNPGVAGIPGRLDGVPTRTVVSGRFVAGALTARVRPAPNGYSLGHPDITAGTLGAIVQDSEDVCYALSNNHVLANSNNADIGDSALQPGDFDGGSDPDDAIGTLADFQVIAFDGSDNRMDAAIAQIFAPVGDFVSATTTSFTPTSDEIGSPTVGLAVKKMGRTTELTSGEITEINVTTSVCYVCGGGPFCFSCQASATFTGQIATGNMSQGGDSGSLLVDSENNNPVGLLFAGSSTRTIYNQIDEVLDRFNATVIQPDDLGSCTNGGGGGDPDPDNNAPTADDVSASGDEDTTILWTPSVSDPDADDTLTCSIASGPSNGSATVPSDCSSGSYTPDENFNGSDSFTYAVSDGSASDQGTVSVTVSPVNDQPVAQDDSYSTPQDEQLIVSAPGVLGNDSDVDGDALSAINATDPPNGTVALDANGSFTYTPDGGFFGTDSFDYTASDGSLIDNATVTITVQEAGSATEMHVGDLDDAGSVNNGSTWTAQVTVTVHDGAHDPVSGVTVSGTWSGGASGGDSCDTLTDGNGQCTVTIGDIAKRNGSATFTIGNLTNTLAYDATANHDPDGDSNGTSITVSKP